MPHRFHPNQSRSPLEISNEQNIEFYRIVQKHQPNHHSSVVVKLPAADQSLSLAILHFLFAQKFPLGKMVYFFRGKQSSLARRRIWSGVLLFRLLLILELFLRSALLHCLLLGDL